MLIRTQARVSPRPFTRKEHVSHGGDLAPAVTLTSTLACGRLLGAPHTDLETKLSQAELVGTEGNAAAGTVPQRVCLLPSRLLGQPWPICWEPREAL